MPGCPASGGASATWHPAAGALHFVPVVLGGLRFRLGQIGSDLVGVLHAQVAGIVQAGAAPADPLREPGHRPVRVLVHFEVRARRAALLPGLALPAAARLRPRRLLPRQVIPAGRHRGVPRVPRDQPFQPREARLQLGVLGFQLGVLGPQVLTVRPQLRVGLLQRDNHIRRIGRIGRTRTTSQPSLSNRSELSAHRASSTTPATRARGHPVKRGAWMLTLRRRQMANLFASCSIKR